MVFKPGENNNPNGSRGRKLFVDALHTLISNKYDGRVPTLPEGATIAHALANRLVSEGLANSKDPKTALSFIQEICDRAYGKPKQVIVGGDEDDNPVQILTTSDQDLIKRYLENKTQGKTTK